MTSPKAPICLVCTRFRDQIPGMTCDAYPEGIPDAILEGQVDHRAPYEGDHGLQFNPADAFATEYAEHLFGKAPREVEE